MKANPNSGQIHVVGQYGTVYLYTHDNAADLLRTVRTVLARKKYWEDEDYLAAMLFREMTKFEESPETDGYGIGTQMYINADMIISLDVPNQRLCINTINSGYRSEYMGFDEFINEFSGKAEL